MDNVENILEEVELTAAEKLAQFEREKLTRRQALARFGFQAGAAAVAALTADELLRKVGKEMQRRAGDNKVAKQVATEFANAGVAMAASNKVAVNPGPPCQFTPSWLNCAVITPRETCCQQNYDACVGAYGCTVQKCNDAFYACSQDGSWPM